MQIGIFETEHFEGAYPVIRLFDNGRNTITIFSYRESYRQFQHLFGDDMSRYQWVVREEDESKYHFMYRIWKETRKRKIELLYLNTISNNFIFYAWLIRLLRPVRISVTLHDVNGYFHFARPKSLRRLVRNVGRKQLVNVVKEFNVVAETMVPHLQSKIPSWKMVHNVPGAVFNPAHYQDWAPVLPGRINIVVPGTVDYRRRNYDVVLELLEKCRHLPVHITLLGGFAQPYGADIKEQCLQVADQYPNFHFYGDSIVDQPEFDKVMNEAHLVFISSVIETMFEDGTEEQYGISISSGNIFDVIKHAKPFIVPDRLQVPDRLSSSVFHYTTVDDIVAFLTSLVSQPERYAALRQQAIDNSMEYTVEKVRARNATLFL